MSYTENDVVDSIPAVDLAAFLGGAQDDRRKIAGEVDEICRTIGFLVVENHGVPAKVIERAWSAAKEFFDLPLEQKSLLDPGDSHCPRGYFPFAEEALAKTQGVDSAPDRKEAFSSGPLSPPAGCTPTADFDFFYGENLWPESASGFREAWIAYYQAMEQLGAQVMQLLASALELDEHFFAEFHGHHLGALRALNYPESSNDGDVARHRAGAHSDYGTVTILRPDPEVGGLEVQLPSAKWIAAPVVTDSFIVNLGDLMARWTNDRWISTLHRVTEAMGEVTPRRQSIAYFMNPNFDAEITALPNCLEPDEDPRYAPTLAGDYLVAQFTEAQIDRSARES